MKKILYTLSLLFFISCGSDSTEKNGNPDNFNRKEMLTFWADAIIIPAYTNFNSKTKELQESIQKFTNTANKTNLVAARKSWEEAYISWQKASLFQIGKAQELNMVGNMNVYPTNVTALKNYINLGVYNFESPNLYEVQGFPALDYLLNGLGTDLETIKMYSTNTNAAKYKKYLKDVTDRVYTLTNKVYKDWKTSYRTTFINNDGYTETSSVDKLVNFYVVPFYEKQFRENKIVTPTGIRTGNLALAKVEAFYKKDISKKLYIASLNTIKNFFKGIAYNETTKGKSLQQYLEFLERKDLATALNTKLDKLATLSATLEDNFVEQINKDRTKMLDLFDAIQIVLKNFKPDMMSAMSVMNTSTDADND